MLEGQVRPRSLLFVDFLRVSLDRLAAHPLNLISASTFCQKQIVDKSSPKEDHCFGRGLLALGDCSRKHFYEVSGSKPEHYHFS